MRNVYSSLKFRMSKHDMPCASEKIIMAEVSGERVERKSTSLDEAERRAKCVELASISTSQRKRLYREQAMLLRLDNVAQLSQLNTLLAAEKEVLYN